MNGYESERAADARMHERPLRRRGGHASHPRERRVERALALALGAALTMAAASCSRAPSDDEAELARSNLSELLTSDLVTGTGAEAVDGRLLRVHYTGWLYHPSHPDHKGREFDSSRRRGVPFEFRLGAGQVIRGWEDGVRGMRGGGLRRLTIPPSLAYGAAGAAGVIPPHATLVFEIELLEVR